MNEEIIKQLASNLNVKTNQVESVLKLFDS